MILVGWRFFAAALATLPLVLAGERNIVAALLPAKAGLRDVALVILIGLLQTAAVMGLLFWAMQFISASTAAILLFTNPICCCPRSYLPRRKPAPSEARRVASWRCRCCACHWYQPIHVFWRDDAGWRDHRHRLCALLGKRDAHQ